MARAARRNKHLEVIRRALGVALGINEAFSKEGRLLKAWLADLADASPPARPSGPVLTPALAWFAGQPRGPGQPPHH
jgi:hypothetical protein